MRNYLEEKRKIDWRKTKSRKTRKIFILNWWYKVDHSSSGLSGWCVKFGEGGIIHTCAKFMVLGYLCGNAHALYSTCIQANQLRHWKMIPTYVDGDRVWLWVKRCLCCAGHRQSPLSRWKRLEINTYVDIQIYWLPGFESVTVNVLWIWFLANIYRVATHPFHSFPFVCSDNYTCGSYEQLDYWANNFDDFAVSVYNNDGGE